MDPQAVSTLCSAGFERPEVNQLVHLLLTLVTFGLWAPVWFMGFTGAAARNG